MKLFGLTYKKWQLKQVLWVYFDPKNLVIRGCAQYLEIFSRLVRSLELGNVSFDREMFGLRF